MKTFFILLALMSFGASAQMVDEPVCYSWEGGHKSSGSFSKCGPRWEVKAPPKVVAAPVPTPQIAPSPIMMPMTCTPEPKATKRVIKRKPAPKKC